MDGSLKKLIENLNFDTDKNCDPILLHPSVLAFVGDSIHNLFIRCYLISKYPSNVNKYHKLSVNYVSAHAQSDTLHKIFENLSEKEKYIIKRGRNIKSASSPKNAEITEYKHATGFEALLGYLYYAKETDRLMEILNMSVDIFQDEVKLEH